MEENKIKALAKFLEVEEDEITELNEDSFAVNVRKVKRGNIPQYYIDSVNEFKKLLSKKSIEKITTFLELVDNLKFLMPSCKTDLQKVRDKLYEKIEKEVKDKPVIKDWLYNSNILFWLLETDTDSYNKETHIKARKAWFGDEIKDDRKLEEINDGEYLILTDSEADERAKEYLEDGELWKQAVEANNTTESLDNWIDDVISIDGRASLLSSYDGCENEEEIDGETYYIYRTN